MHKRVVLLDHFSSDSKNEDGLIWIPINRSLLGSIQKDRENLKTGKDLLSRVRVDLGLLLLALRIRKITDSIVIGSSLSEIKLESEDLDEFLSLAFNLNYFDISELKEFQLSSYKISSIYGLLVERGKIKNKISAYRLIMIPLYFSIYCPTWFEKSVKKSGGNFEDLLIRSIECGPVKVPDIEKFFFKTSISGSILDDYVFYRELLLLSAASEPEVFFLTASGVEDFFNATNVKSFGLTRHMFEETIEFWSQKWHGILPKRFTQNQDLYEIQRIAKQKKGIKLFEEKGSSLKIFDVDQKIFENFFSEVTHNQPSVEGLRILFTDILPSSGFNLGIVFLKDNKKSVLVPKVVVGSARETSVPVVFLNNLSADEFSIQLAVETEKTQKVEQGRLFGIDGSFFVVPFEFSKHSGVMIVGMNPEDPHSITIEALKKAEYLVTLLGYALGYT